MYELLDLQKLEKVKSLAPLFWLLDAIICATSILHGATLCTNDVKLKNITNLKLKILKI